jgi:putative PIN family toxin of toxin-antitoxin system
MGRVVIDTSTLVGAMLRPASKPRQALLAVVTSHALCVSQSTLAELQVVLQRPKFDPYAPLQTRLDFLEVVTQTAHLFEIDTASEAASLGACRDPKDDKFLALAMACEAVTLISSDADLLSLQRWRDIAILSPADFLSSANQTSS